MASVCRDYKNANDTIKRLLDSKNPGAAGSLSGLGGVVANNQKDAYGRLAYGNLNMALAPTDRKKPDDAEKAREKLVKVRSWRIVSGRETADYQ